MSDFKIYYNVIFKYTGNEEHVVIPEGIKGIFQGAFQCNKTLKEIQLPSTLKRIGEKAFADCIALRSITIPESVKTIEEGAFDACTGLFYVTAKEKFYPCFHDTPWFLINYTDYDGYTIFRNVLYRYAGNVKYIYIPDTVKDVECNAFKEVYNAYIIFPENIKQCLNVNLNRDCFTFYTGIPINNHKLYGYSVSVRIMIFYKLIQDHRYISDEVKLSYINYICDHIEDIYDKEHDISMIFFLLNNYTLTYEQYSKLGMIFDLENAELSALYLNKIKENCTVEDKIKYEEKKERFQFGEYIQEDLKEVWEIVKLSDEEAKEYEQYDQFHNYHNSYKVIGYNNNLEDETIPSMISGKRITVVDIKSKCLKNIILEEGIYSIGNDFGGRDVLESITLPSSITILQTDVFQCHKALKEIHLSNGLQKIGKRAFLGCTSLSSIVIPDTVTSIGRQAFCYCISLEKVHLSSSLKIIRFGTFFSCHSLKDINLPDHLIKIENHAFSYCYCLNKLKRPESLKKVSYNAFFYSKYGIHNFEDI